MPRPFVMTKEDEEFLLRNGFKYNEGVPTVSELEDSYSQLQDDAEEIRETPPAKPSTVNIAPDEPGVSDYIKQGVGSAMRGASEMAASIPESLAILNTAVRRRLPESMQGMPIPFPGFNLPPEVLQAEADVVRGAGERISPANDPRLQDSMLATKIPAGLGSAAAFLAGGVAGAAAKVPAWLTAAGLGAMSTSSEWYKDAKAHGADDDTAELAGLIGGTVGTSEAFPMAQWINRVAKITGVNPSKFLISAGKETIEESFQELFQQFAQNYTANKLYDKDRDLLTGLAESAQVGGGTGFLFSLLTHALGRSLGAKLRPKAGEQPPPLPATPPPLPGTQQIAPDDMAEMAARYQSTPEEVAAVRQKIEEVSNLEAKDSDEVRVWETMQQLADLNVKVAQATQPPPQPATPTVAPSAPVVSPTAPIVPAAAPTVSAPTAPVPDSLSRVRAAAVQAPPPPPLDEQAELLASLAASQEDDELPDLDEPAPAPVVEKKAMRAVKPPKPAPQPEVKPAATGRREFSVQEVVDLAAFNPEEGSAVVAAESGQGVKAAAPWEKTSDINRATVDSTAMNPQERGAYGMSRKLVLLTAADGTHGILASAYDPRSPKVHTPEGGKSLASLTTGKSPKYVMVGAMKLNSPLFKFNQQLTPEQVGQLVSAADARQSDLVSQVLPIPSEVETTTPADVVAAAEGFTRDEAGAIYDATAKLGDDFKLDDLAKVATKNPDLLHALAKMIEAFELAGDDSMTAGAVALGYVKDARRSSGSSKTTFEGSLLQKVRDHAPGGRSETAQTKAGGPIGATDVARGTKSRAAKAGGEGAEQGKKPRLKRTRSRRGRLIESTERVELENRRLIDDVMDGIEKNGWSVTELRKEIDGMLLDAGGQTSPAGRSILLYVADSLSPNRDNFTTLLHEAADAVSEEESPEVQAMLQRAIAKLSDEELGIAGWSPAISDQVQKGDEEQVHQLERLSESVARKLTAEGMDPGKARSLWDAIVRFLRDMWYRAGIAIQKMALGEDAVGTELLEKYFVNRLTSFVSGDAEFVSFPSWMGGPKWTGGQYADSFRPANGQGELEEEYDPETGEMVYREAVETSPEAVRFNQRTRLRSPTITSSPTTDISQEAREESAEVGIKIAAANELKDIASRLYDKWDSVGGNSSGVPQSTFTANQTFVPMGNQDGIIAQHNAGLQLAGKPLVSTVTRINSLPTEVAQKKAAAIAHQQAQEMQDKMSAQAREFGWSLSDKNDYNILGRLERSIKRVRDLTQKRFDITNIISQSLDAVGDMFGEMRRDIRGAVNKARRLGRVMQTIKQVDEDLDDNSSREYEVAVNRLYNRWRTTDGAQQFSKTLEALSDIDTIDWKNENAKAIRDKILAAANGNAALQHLSTPGLERRAELSMLIAFGRSHSYVLSLLQARKLKAEDGGAQLNQAIKTAMSNTTDSFGEARKIVRSLPRASRQATRIIDALEKAKLDHRAALDDVRQRQTYVEYFNDVSGTLENEVARLASQIEAERNVDMVDGAEYSVPENPTDPADKWTKKNLELRTNGSVPEEVHADIRKMKDYLDRTPSNQWSSTQRTMASTVRKLETLIGSTIYQANHANHLTRWFGSITDKLNQTGHPSARAAAQAISRIASFIGWGKTDVESQGVRWSKAEGQVMKAFKKAAGRSIPLDSWRRLYNDALHYINSRQDIYASEPDVAAADEKSISALRNYWMSTPETHRLASDPEFWTAMKRYLKQTGEGSALLTRAAKAMGLKVQDLQFLRVPLGSPLSHVMRRITPEAMGLWEGMKKDWGGASESGEVSGQLKARKIAEQHESNPKQLATDLAPRFGERVWREFVGELVRQPNKPVFYQPSNADVKLLAKRANIVAAYNATSPGDILGFVRNLYTLEQPHTQNEPMTESEYAGEILETMQQFFNTMHGMFADKANADEQGNPLPRRVMMDARVMEELPPGWFEYQPMDALSLRLLIRSMAFQAGGGRNLSEIRRHFGAAREDLDRLQTDYSRLVRETRELNPSASLSKLRDILKAEAEKQGGAGHLTRMENAAANMEKVKGQEKNFHGMVRSLLDFPMELRFFVELVGTLAGLTVQGPGTSLSDQASLVIQPFRHLGFGKEAAKMAAGNLKGFAEAVFGSLAQTVSTEVGNASEHNRLYRKLGLSDPDAYVHYKDKLMEIAHEDLYEEPTAGRGIVSRGLIHLKRGARKAARGARATIGSGFARIREGDKFAYPTLKFPHGLFTMASQAAHFASVKSAWQRFETLMGKAVEYFESHPMEMSDDKFKFTNKMLGYGERPFLYYTNRLNDFGIDLEAKARDYMRQRATNPNVPLFTDSEYQRLAMLGSSETLLESSMLTRPPGFINNPALAIGSPLLGWSISAANDMQKALGSPNGDLSKKAFATGLLAYAAILPVGLAMALIRDWFDDEVLGRKANIQRVQYDQGLTWENTRAAVQQLARVGTFGLAGDFADAAVNIDSARPFNVDNRVFLLNSIQGIKNAAIRMIAQGGRADYGYTVRPAIQAMGGSGYLQIADAINKTLSRFDVEPLFEAEAKQVARMNVNSYLKSAARATSPPVDVRVSNQSFSIPHPSKPYVAEMMVNALANDPRAFRQAWVRAIKVATQEGRSRADAEKYVRERFQSLNPLVSNFTTKPDEKSFRRMLGAMDEDGRRAVMTALRNYEHYGRHIGARVSLYGQPK